MGCKEFINDRLIFQICYYYYNYRQFVFGTTFTKETHNIVGDKAIRQNEYCLNIWLGLISFHIALFGAKRHGRV